MGSRVGAECNEAQQLNLNSTPMLGFAMRSANLHFITTF